MEPVVARLVAATGTVMQHQAVITEVSKAAASITRGSEKLEAQIDQISKLQGANGATAEEIRASGELKLLAFGLGKYAVEFTRPEALSPEGVFLFGKGLSAFQTVLAGLIASSGSPKVVESLKSLEAAFANTTAAAFTILGQLQPQVATAEAFRVLRTDATTLDQQAVELCQGQERGLVQR
jgi:hypothetical protein